MTNKYKKQIEEHNRRVYSSKSLTLSQTTSFRLFQTERVCRRQFQT